MMSEGRKKKSFEKVSNRSVEKAIVGECSTYKWVQDPTHLESVRSVAGNVSWRGSIQCITNIIYQLRLHPLKSVQSVQMLLQFEGSIATDGGLKHCA